MKGDFARELRVWRAFFGLSQARASVALGVATRTLGRWEREESGPGTSDRSHVMRTIANWYRQDAINQGRVAG